MIKTIDHADASGEDAYYASANVIVEIAREIRASVWDAAVGRVVRGGRDAWCNLCAVRVKGGATPWAVQFFHDLNRLSLLDEESGDMFCSLDFTCLRAVEASVSIPPPGLELGMDAGGIYVEELGCFPAPGAAASSRARRQFGSI